MGGERPQGERIMILRQHNETVAQVATGHGRSAIYIDLNPKYLTLAEQRIGPMLCERVA